MKMRASSLTAFFALALTAILAAGCGNFSLAADVTPPPDYVTPTPAPTLDLAAAVPSGQPSLARGGMLYMEKCAPCHGIAGMGDGPQAGNLPVSVPALASAAEVRGARPLDWYKVVTTGRMERMMPAFDSLDSGQKWDILSYVFSLGTTPEMLAEGKTLYESQCLSCHGPAGKGDGPSAASLNEKASDWSSPASLMELSQQELIDIIQQGKGAAMPAYKDKLNPDQLVAAAAYIQQLSVEPMAPEAAAPTAELAAVPAAGATLPAATETAAPGASPVAGTPAGTSGPALAVISGKVTNASGGALPAGLKAILESYDSMQPAQTRETEVGADGSFKWDGVEVLDKRVYLVRVDYNGAPFRSQVIHGTDLKAGQTLSTSVAVYDTTSDRTGLTIERMHVFFDFSSPDSVQVVEMALISNPGKKMIIAPEAGKALIEFALPTGYQDLQFQDGQIGGRYVQTANGFGDTDNIVPGNAAHQVLFAYKLAYKNSAKISLNAPLDVANAILMVPQNGVSLNGEGLQDGGERTLQEGVLHLYTASNLKAGSTLELELSGRPGQGSVFTSGTKSELLIGLGVLVLVLVGVAFYLLNRREGQAETAAAEEGGGESVDSLLDAIVALDDLYRAGKLTKPAWQERRDELKENLRAVREKGTGSKGE